MRKTKVLFVLFLIICISIIPFSHVNAHSIELDPEGLISFPWFITNGAGTITIDDSQTGYSLSYQAVEISNEEYSKIEEIRNNGETALDLMNVELDTLKAEIDNLKTAYDEAYDKLTSLQESGASEDEIALAQTEFDTAQIAYQEKAEEYNTKVDEYNTKVNEVNNSIKELTPTYVENNWVKTEDGSFSVDLSQFSGDKAYVIWVKLDTVDGNTYYDEAIYTMTGTKVDEVAIESISLDKTLITIAEGSSYTLVATINPSDSTDKTIIWSSDNEDVATVKDGKVTAISAGTATITASTEDGEHTATCKVTVTKQGATQDNGDTDSTIANGKLPEAGSLTYVILSLAILTLIVVAIITYKKVKYLNIK